eukprot:6321281-Karenia_brevis.AAC.1
MGDAINRGSPYKQVCPGCCRRGYALRNSGRGPRGARRALWVWQLAVPMWPFSDSPRLPHHMASTSLGSSP